MAPTHRAPHRTAPGLTALVSPAVIGAHPRSGGSADRTSWQATPRVSAGPRAPHPTWGRAR
jgi:hypothetical protein